MSPVRRAIGFEVDISPRTSGGCRSRARRCRPHNRGQVTIAAALVPTPASLVRAAAPLRWTRRPALTPTETFACPMVLIVCGSRRSRSNCCRLTALLGPWLEVTMNGQGTLPHPGSHFRHRLIVTRTTPEARTFCRRRLTPPGPRNTEKRFIKGRNYGRAGADLPVAGRA